MDPSIVRLLEEDEDETMHSGAAVEAFTAALNRDIGGDPSLSLTDDSVLPQGSQSAVNQIPEWQNSAQGDDSTDESKQLKYLCQQKHIAVGTDEKKSACDGDGDRKQTQENNIFSMQQKEAQEIHHGSSTQHEVIQQSQGNHQEPATRQTPIQLQASATQVSEQKMSESWPELQTPLQFSQSMIAEMKSASTSVEDMERDQYTKVPFALLLPALTANLDTDRAMQIRTLFDKLKANEVSKNGFIRLVKNIVGRDTMMTAYFKLHSQYGPNYFPISSMKMASISGQQFSDPHPTAQLHQKGHNSSGDAYSSSSALVTQGGSTRSPAELIRKSDPQMTPVGKAGSSSLIVPSQESDYHSTVMQGIVKQNPQNFRFPHLPFPAYGTGGIPAPPHVLQPGILNQNPGLKHLSGTPHRMVMMRQSSTDEMKRAQGVSFPNLPSNTVVQLSQASSHRSPKILDHNSGVLAQTAYVKQEPFEQRNEQQKYQTSVQQGPSSIVASQVEQRNSSMVGPKGDILEQESSPMAAEGEHYTMSSTQGVPITPSAGLNVKTPPKKALIGQKKPLETRGSSPPFPSKKQKLFGTSMDQSIEQLNDVTAVSGVNIREEEEQLFSGSKEEARVSEASRKAVQEEEEKLILQRIPLKNKISQIMGKYGIKGISMDVERCISLCVEERLRGLIHNLVRLSKQRAETDKMRHKVFITSDVQQKIQMWKKKSKDEWESKRAETEKLHKPDERGGEDGVEGDKDRGDSRAKQPKINREEDDKMRATAANVAARAAVGGDDMFSKWQLMAEQAREKREGVRVDLSSISHQDKEASHNLLPSSRETGMDGHESEKGIFSTSAKLPGTWKQARRQEVGAVLRSRISKKDVLSVLEREPQMSKSTLVYRLYEKSGAAAAAQGNQG